MIPKPDLHRLYQDKCDVFSLNSRIDLDSQETITEWVKIYSDIPCRISFSTPYTTDDDEKSVNFVRQLTKLFIDPEYDIQPGYKIVVTRDGNTFEYQYAGESNYYESHREIELKSLDFV
jgi:hypothetical protein